jgi:hypothetical protein
MDSNSTLHVESIQLAIGGFEETLALPPEVQSEMEIAVLTACKEKLKKASAEDKNAASGGDT